MSYKLFLDDFRNPIDCLYYINNPIYAKNDWKIVRDYEEFIDFILKNGLPKVVSFDHDLSDVHYTHQNVEIPYEDYEEKTGYHCAQWLIEYCLDNNKKLPSTILIHSMNNVGVKNIKSLFDTYKKIHGNK